MSSSTLLIAFQEYLHINKALEANTIKSYLSDLRQFQKHFHKQDILKLKTMDVFSFLIQFENKRTLNRKLSSINAFYAFCHKLEFSNSNINIPMAKVPKNLPKYLSFDEIQAGLQTIDRSKLLGLRDYALILFLYASGCRISEAILAKREDLNMENPNDAWLKIRFAKGQKERMIPIAPIAIQALEAYLKQASMQSEYLWLNYRGEALSRISAYKIIKSYLNVSPHVLRHSFASALILGGADLRVIQELLGHSSLETTQIYTHIQQENLAETMNAYHPLAKG
ncbi:MAG: Tyrosine recombinase xerD [uncultured Sulfurovum sp.]|uniref:Tyrosine recombinase xerD n=1 Tax=uncultured Sulfurovum sp. TaxID=269237 RepID=A0A6S6THQ1_9BACT|nr:MAG: Tyrosine recombinase xerD [uncultured Sulfurovum sp.]